MPEANLKCTTYDVALTRAQADAARPCSFDPVVAGLAVSGPGYSVSLEIDLLGTTPHIILLNSSGPFEPSQEQIAALVQVLGEWTATAQSQHSENRRAIVRKMAGDFA